MSRAATIVLLALLALLAPGTACTFTHRCPVPTPVVEAASGARVPLAVEVRYEPATVPTVARARSSHGPGYGAHETVVEADSPTRALFDRLAASMFERAARPADLLLAVRLERFRVGAVPFGSFTSEVAYHATLRTPEGSEIAAFDVAGAASVAGSLRTLGFCGARGEAVAVAMQEAGADALRQVSASGTLAAWLASRGLAAPSFTVRPIEAYATPTAMAIPTATEPPATTPGAIPVRATPAGAVRPRAMSLRGGLGVLRPETTAGKLEEPSRGLGDGYVGLGARLLGWLWLDLPLEVVTRNYSARAIPHLTGFGPRATLESLSFGAGFRVTPPLGERPVLEPWVGASARLLHTTLTATYFGGLTGGDPTDTAWSAGGDVGAGLNLYPGGRWVLGLEVRRILARAHLDPLGGVRIGGVVIGGSLGATFPP